MYCRSETGVYCCIGDRHTCHFTYQMAALFCMKWCHGSHPESVTSNWKSDCQSMHVFVKNILTKFYPDPLWNYGALSFFEQVCPQKEQKTVVIRDQFWSKNKNNYCTLFLSFITVFFCIQYVNGKGIQPVKTSAKIYGIPTLTAHKKSELPQRWPCDATYILVPWKFSRVTEYAHGYFSQNF